MCAVCVYSDLFPKTNTLAILKTIVKILSTYLLPLLVCP